MILPLWYCNKAVVDQPDNNVNTLKYYNDNCQQNCHDIGLLRVSREKNNGLISNW